MKKFSLFLFLTLFIFNSLASSSSENDDSDSDGSLHSISRPRKRARTEPSGEIAAASSAALPSADTSMSSMGSLQLLVLLLQSNKIS